METVFVVSLIIFTVIIAAAALGLIRVILHLRSVVKTLDALDGGVALIGELETTPSLLETTDATIKDVANGAVRYAGSVAKLLG